MKVTKYCADIKALEQVIGWVLPMVTEDTSREALHSLYHAKHDLLDLRHKRDRLLDHSIKPD